MNINRSAVFSALMAVLVVGSAGIVAAASMNDLDTGADAAHDPEINTVVTKAVHNMSEMGTDAKMYYNDSGDLATLPGQIRGDEWSEGDFRYIATDVDANDFSAFPHAKDDVSALEASEWSKDLSSSAGSGSITNVNTAPGVEAVSLSTSGQSAGDVATFTFSNFSITSDEKKRYLQIAADVNTLGSSTVGNVSVVDDDGDEKRVAFATGLNQSHDDVLANQTGEGHVSQVQLGSLTTMGSGDGSFDSIQKVVVTVKDGNADLDMSLLNVDRLGGYNFGANANESSIREPHGTITVSSLGTLGSAFNNADIHNLQFPFQATAKAMGDGDVKVKFSEATDYTDYESHATQYFRMSIPSAYDLSYSNTVLNDSQPHPTNRYQQVAYSEASGSTKFGNISSWTQITSSYDSKGQNLTIDGSVTPGEENVIKVKMLVTGAEKQNMMTAGGGAGIMATGAGGGFLGSLVGKASALVGAVLVALGIKKRRGGS